MILFSLFLQEWAAGSQWKLLLYCLENIFTLRACGQSIYLYIYLSIKELLPYVIVKPRLHTEKPHMRPSGLYCVIQVQTTGWHHRLMTFKEQAVSSRKTNRLKIRILQLSHDWAAPELTAAHQTLWPQEVCDQVHSNPKTQESHHSSVLTVFLPCAWNKRRRWKELHTDLKL